MWKLISSIFFVAVFCSNGTAVKDADFKVTQARFLPVFSLNDNSLRTNHLRSQNVNENFQGCGKRTIDELISRKYQDDSIAGAMEFPWMMAILVQEQVNYTKTLNIYKCGGSLIHPRVVLTAAHCVESYPISTLSIRAGEWDTQSTNELYPHQVRSVAKTVHHPDYYAGALFNDIALVFLQAPFNFAPNVQTICLPPKDYSFDHDRCFASGWGKDVFGVEGQYQVFLKKLELPIVPKDQCESTLRTTRLSRRFKLHASFICAGGEAGIDTCKGDGGAPLVCKIPYTSNQYYQAGIVAWGIGCGNNFIPGVYANVAMFRDWIDQKMVENGFDGAYYTYGR